MNPPAGLSASHEWMGDVSTIPEAGPQNPRSDKTPSSSASQDSTQSDELKGVTSLETALVRALQRDMVARRKQQNSLGGPSGCDVYEVRPRKSRDGVDLISDQFRYGPIWYAGPDAVRNAVAYAKYRSLLRSQRAKICELDDFGAVVHTH